MRAGRSSARPISESIPTVDRQWIAFTDDKTALFTYNGPHGKTVQKSTDGGLTYGPPVTVSTDSGRIGQIRAVLRDSDGNVVSDGSVADPGKAVAYIPYNSGNKVRLVVTRDGGDTWDGCTVVDAGVDPTAGFIAADSDDAGNTYVVYSEKGGGRDTYLVVVPFDQLVTDCRDGANLNRPRIQVNTGDAAKTTLFPWVAAAGAPGRVAVAFYGTDQVGNPDSGSFQAAWNVFVSQSLDALDQTPHVATVTATTHPFHYDSICTAGLNCDINGADRSLVDYFTLEYNRGSGALQLVYSQPAKRPGDAEGYIAAPAVVTQVAGPSNGGGVVDRGFRKETVRTSSPDPEGDAISGYSILDPAGETLSPGNVAMPALDLVSRDGQPAVSVGPEVDADGNPVDGGGFSVTMRFKDLSDDALNAALDGAAAGGGSLIYLYRFYNGYQPNAASARYDRSNGWTFAFSGYDQGADGNETIFPKDQDLTGVLDVDAGTIRLDVPLSYLKALGPVDGANRPTEIPAEPGSRIYDATAFTLVNTSPDPDTQSFMEQVDNAPSFDFLIGAAPGADLPEAPLAVLVPLAALVALTVVWVLRGRSTA